MSDYAVTIPTVAQTSSATRGAAADLEEELRSLRREVDAVLTEGWRGAAAAAFDRAWGEWDAGAREVMIALRRLAELLETSGRAYLESDDSASTRLRLAAGA